MSATTISPPKPNASKRKASKVSRKITTVVLPRSVITAAAQFTSRESHKMVLQCIHIYYESKEDKTIVVSSDGHRLFRCKLPGQFVSEPLLLHSDDRNFRSFAGKADSVRLQLDQREPYYAKTVSSDSKGNKKKLIWKDITAEFLDADGQRVRVHIIQDRRDWGTFPNTDQLIPDRRGMGQDDVMYNAFYLGEFCKVANKFSQFNHIKQILSSPNTPNLFECDVELPIPFGDTVKFELLLMPVQQR